MYTSRAARQPPRLSRAALGVGRPRSASALPHGLRVHRISTALARHLSTLPREQLETTHGDEAPLSRLEELRLRLQLEQEGMQLEAFASTVLNLEAAAVPVPRGRQKEAKPSWLKHNALKKTDPTTVQGQNYLRLKKDVRRKCSAQACSLLRGLASLCSSLHCR